MKRIIYLISTLPLLLLVGCNNDDLEQELEKKPTANAGDIVFNISIDSKPQTRTATTADFKTAFEDGDKIGIFSVSHAAGTPAPLAASGNAIHNVKLTYSIADGGKWTPETPLYYKGEQMDFYAYYPYNASATDPTNITFNVEADQSIEANYNLSDLLSASAGNIANGTASVNLTFAHKLALMQVEVEPGTMKGSGPSDHLALTLSGFKAGGTFNLGTESLTTAGDAVAVKMLRVEKSTDANYERKYTYRALVPAQNVASGKSLCVMSQGGFFYNTPKLTSALPLTAGDAKRYSAKLPATAIQTVKISAGTFLMGSSDGSNTTTGTAGVDPNATPKEPNRKDNEIQHKVTLTKDYYMSKYQITFAQYDAFCDATGKGTPSDENWGRGDRPVINVSWNDAVAYCEWLSGVTGGAWRLPTEAEWEYACRGGKENHPFGIGTGYELNNTNANFDWQRSWSWDGTSATATIDNTGIYPSKTQPVGSYTANSYGLYDMHGNVWEWCLDNYRNDYQNLPETDPVNTSSGNSYRVLRGGSWFYKAQYCRSAYRYDRNPDDAYSNFGFRVVFVPQ